MRCSLLHGNAPDALDNLLWNPTVVLHHVCLGLTKAPTRRSICLEHQKADGKQHEIERPLRIPGTCCPHGLHAVDYITPSHLSVIGAAPTSR